MKCLDLNDINQIIDETPYISDLNKEFLKFTILDRKENLLEFAIAKNQNFLKLHSANISQQSKKGHWRINPRTRKSEWIEY